MTTYLIKRFIVLVLTLLLVSIVIFVVMRIIPGDPAEIILGIQATPEAVAALRAQLGLDRPLAVQYIGWLSELVRGNMGQSINYGVSIAGLVVQRLAVTGPLTLMAVLFSVAISVPLGIYAATHQNRPGDYGVMVFSQVGLALLGGSAADSAICRSSSLVCLGRVSRLVKELLGIHKKPPSAGGRTGVYPGCRPGTTDPVISSRSAAGGLHPNGEE